MDRQVDGESKRPYTICGAQRFATSLATFVSKNANRGHARTSATIANQPEFATGLCLSFSGSLSPEVACPFPVQGVAHANRAGDKQRSIHPTRWPRGVAGSLEPALLAERRQDAGAVRWTWMNDRR